MNTPYEPTVNVYLSELLNNVISDRGEAIPEKPVVGKPRRFDVKIDYKGVEFIIEASYDKKDAVKDAMKRIEEGLIDTVALAVYYNPEHFSGTRTPNEIKNALLNNPLEVKVFARGTDISQSLFRFISGKNASARQITPDWICIKLNDFGEFLDAIIEFVVQEDVLSRLIEDIDNDIRSFIADTLEILSRNPQLKQKVISKLYKVLFSPSEGESGDLIVSDVPEDVILANTYVSLLMASIFYESVAPQHSLDSIQELLTRYEHPILTMKEAFVRILSINYEPVFDLSIALLDILFVLQSYPSIIHLLKSLINTSSRIVGNKAILKQDFIGYVYHKITSDVATRKGYATFYTKAPVAYFLLYLALHAPNDEWSDIDWSSVESIRKFKICDFACGSGTLLSASYYALLSKYRKSCFEKSVTPSLANFHKILLENSIWGFDALEHAVQTASVVMCLHEPEVALNYTNVYHVPIDATGSLGSLNFWWAKTLLVPIKRRTVSEIKRKSISLSKFDLIVMNPPFSRTTATGKKESRPRIFDFVTNQNTFEKLWNEYKLLINCAEKEITSRHHIQNLINLYVGKDRIFKPRDIDALKAGAALPFVFLADKYLKKGGRLALVLPKTVLESSSFFLLRAMLLSNYHIEYIILSKEPNNPNFSYSTDFSEILLIAKKVGNNLNSGSSKTTVIVFNKQPKNLLEGVLLAKEILKISGEVETTQFAKAVFSEAKIYSISEDLLNNFVWNLSILTDTSADLLKLISDVIAGDFGIKIPMKSLTELNINLVNPRVFRGKEFKNRFSLIERQSRYRILRKTGKSIYNKLILDLKNTDFIEPKSEQAREFYRGKSGRVLIPEALRFNFCCC